MWNELVLLNELDTYFNQTSKEQIMQDIKDSGSLLFIEEVDEEDEC